MNQPGRCLYGLRLFLFVAMMPALPATAQIKGQVLDSTDDGPVPFANIQIEGNREGTTADEQGRFSLPASDSNKMIVISAVGYGQKKVPAWSSRILLGRSSLLLDEVSVSSSRKQVYTRIGSFKKSDVRLHFAANGNPSILARYFPYDTSYRKTPFLQSVMLETNSEVKNARFQLRFYRRDADGKPGAYLCEEPVPAYADKGKRYTRVDLSSYNLSMPPDGLFIAIEFLVIDANRYTYPYTMESTGKKGIDTLYAPLIGALPAADSQHAWLYEGGQWKPMFRNGEEVHNSRYRGQYNLFAMELTLSD